MMIAINCVRVYSCPLAVKVFIVLQFFNQKNIDDILNLRFKNRIRGSFIFS